MESIKREEFIELIKMHQNQSDRIDNLSKAGLDIWDSPVIEYGNLMFDKIIESYFTEEGSDWIYWWMCEKDGNPDMKAWNENQEEIPTETIEDLWNIVEKYRK